MKKKSHKSAFFNPRFILGLVLCLFGVQLAVFALHNPEPEKLANEVPVAASVDDAQRLAQFWTDRLTYPTGQFNPAWLRDAAAQHDKMATGIPAGNFSKLQSRTGAAQGLQRGGKALVQPKSLSTAGFTSLGPAPEIMTGCSGCFDYGTTQGRGYAIVVDPTTTSNGTIVAYLATVGGGVWKTTNCCSASTSWISTTDDPLIAVSSVGTLAMDPNNHNVVYAGTGFLNSDTWFNMGSQGILKTIDGGQHWVLLGSTVFGPDYTEPAGLYPQYDAVGKIRVDPNNGNNVVAGTKKGLFFSYDGGNSWTGPCLTNSFSNQRQDTTGLELSNMGGGVTRIIAAVGARGFANTVEYDITNNGANGIYTANMVSSGCPAFSPIASDANGFVFGTQVTGSPYGTGGQLHAGSGAAYVSTSTTTNVGNQLGRIDITVAPSNPNVIYAQVQSIAPNSNSGTAGCSNANGCQLGAFSSTDGGASWNFMNGSAGGSLRACATSGGGVGTAGGDSTRNQYDQAIAVDPNDPTKTFFATYVDWFATQAGSSWYDTTCAFTQPALGVHSFLDAIAYVPGSSSILLTAGDGGVNGTINANAVNPGVTRPTWFHMLNGLNTIEFFSGDISANFANDSSPSAVGGAFANGPSSVTFSGSPTGPVSWQEGLGGDGFGGFINSGGTGPTSAQGTITVASGGATAGQTFQIGSQTFTFVSSGTATGQVVLNASSTTEATNIVTAITRDIGGIVTAIRSGSTAIVTAIVGGASGNSMTFVNNNSANFSMNGSGFLGGTTSGGGAGTTQPVFFQVNSSGNIARCISNCTAAGASWTTKTASTWTSTGEARSFIFPAAMFHGGIPGGDDCPNGACGHLLGGTTRVWETITANYNQTNATTTWYITNNPSTQNLTKGSLSFRSYINQVKYSPKFSSVAIVGTSDGNVQIGFNLGTGAAGQANWVDVTGSNATLPNRPILGIALDPSASAANVPVGYAAVGGFNANSPTTPGHVFQVTCAANCASFLWADKTGNLPDIPVDSIIANPNYPQQVFAGTDWGVYFTNDITQTSPTWYRFANAPHTMVWDMSIDRGSTTLALWTRGRGAWVFPLTSSDIALPAPILTAAVSRFTHGSAGTFDLNLPVDGKGIEPRGDGTGNYQIILTFDQPINGGSASVISGTASASVAFGNGSVSPDDASGNTMAVNLTGVTDQQTVGVSITGVSSPGTFTAQPILLNVGFLNGDVNGDGVVNVGDSVLVRNHAGDTLDNTNFQYDINADGVVNVGDTVIVRNRSGDSLP